MKFNGKNGGMAIAVRNHIMLFRSFVISLFIFIVPTVVFICNRNPYFWVFLIMPLFFLVVSLVVFFGVKYDDERFLAKEIKDHIFEIKNNCIFKDGKEIKLIQSVKIYRYKGFLYMETSHSMFIVKDTDFVIGTRKEFLTWAKSCRIKVLCGY